MISDNLKQLFIDTMNIKYLARRTKETYLSELNQYNKYLGKIDIRFVSKEDIIKYLSHLESLDYSRSKINQSINAIKFFKENVLGNKRTNYFTSLRPKQTKYIPSFISSSEAWECIENVSNLKHKAIIAFIFTHGLRRQEAIDFKLCHFNKEDQTIKIVNSKGFKDRIIPLNKRCKLILSEYIKQYRPKLFLFEGKPFNKYSASSIRNIVLKAFESINQNITPHSLRHSYGTALRELGVDLDDIRKLMGHSSTKTTEIYNHTATNYLNKLPQV